MSYDPITEAVHVAEECVCASIEHALTGPEDQPVPYGPVGDVVRKVLALRFDGDEREGRLSAAELDEECQRLDDLAEEFGLDRECAYLEIKTALREWQLLSKVPVVREARGVKFAPVSEQTIEVPAQVAVEFMELLQAVEAIGPFTEYVKVINAGQLVIEQAAKCRSHLDTFGADIDPGFGVDPADSAALQELRMAIDTHFGWRNTKEEQAADYVGRVKQVANGIVDAQHALALIDSETAE